MSAEGSYPDAEWRIAKINRATLGYEDHGILTASLDLNYGDSGQGAGGYCLDSFDRALNRRVGTAYGMEFIVRLLRAVGVREWSQLEGRTIYALSSHSKVHGIKPLPTEGGEPFMFDDLAVSFGGYPS